MFSLEQSGPTGGDCTASYEVTLDKVYTVKEFVNDVLSKAGEWGYINIQGNSYTMSYKYGKMETPMMDSDGDKTISSVSAHGGWSRMDYHITIKEEI